MKKEIKDIWVKALRSGEYKQTKGVLRKGDSFCCLGVLCNLHAIAHPEFAATQTNPESYDDCDIFLPKSVMDWAGMNVNNGEYLDGNRRFKCLTEHNDEDGMQFDEIADVIDQYWEKL